MLLIETVRKGACAHGRDRGQGLWQGGLVRKGVEEGRESHVLAGQDVHFGHSVGQRLQLGKHCSFFFRQGRHVDCWRRHHLLRHLAEREIGSGPSLVQKRASLAAASIFHCDRLPPPAPARHSTATAPVSRPNEVSVGDPCCRQQAFFLSWTATQPCQKSRSSDGTTTGLKGSLRWHVCLAVIHSLVAAMGAVAVPLPKQDDAKTITKNIHVPSTRDA